MARIFVVKILAPSDLDFRYFMPHSVSAAGVGRHGIVYSYHAAVKRKMNEVFLRVHVRFSFGLLQYLRQTQKRCCHFSGPGDRKWWTGSP